MNIARSYEALGHELGISRVTMHEWRKMESSPNSMAVSEWIDFIAVNGLKGSDRLEIAEAGERRGRLSVKGSSKAVASDGSEGVGGTQLEWKNRKLKLDGDKVELDVLKKKGQLLVASEIEIPLGASLIGVANRVTQLPELLAPLVVGQLDVSDIMEIMRPEVQNTLAGLNIGDFTEDIEAIAANLNASAEAVAIARQIVASIGLAKVEIWRKEFEAAQEKRG